MFRTKQKGHLQNLAKALISPTYFETDGWKRIPFFPSTLEQFGFDSCSAELSLQEVDLPISIGNEKIYNAIGSPYKSHSKTFFVRK